MAGQEAGPAVPSVRPCATNFSLMDLGRSNPEASPLPHFREKCLHLFGEIKSSHLSRRALGAAHSHHHAGTQGPATLDPQGLRLGKLSRNAFAFFFFFNGPPATRPLVFFLHLFALLPGRVLQLHFLVLLLRIPSLLSNLNNF